MKTQAILNANVYVGIKVMVKHASCRTAEKILACVTLMVASVGTMLTLVSAYAGVTMDTEVHMKCCLEFI